MNKKIMVLAIFLVSLMCVSAVNAAENATEDIADAQSDDAIADSSLKEDILADGGHGNFTELKTMIDNAQNGSTITLEKDYVRLEGEIIYSNTRAGYYGMEIIKPLTIDGNGHKIDSRGNGGIFKLYGSGIVLKNITFANGKTNEGGALYILEGSGNQIVSCNFINCSAKLYGGAIDNAYADDVEIFSCNFTNCSSNYGAILNRGIHLWITSCNFNGCHGYYGGAFFNWGEDSFVTSCNFTDCYSSDLGGAITSDVEYLEIVSCNFVACHANTGGAIYGQDSGRHFMVISCSFKDCQANSGGAIYTKQFGSESCIDSCNFTNCSDRAIFFSGYYYNNDFNYNVTSCNFRDCRSTDYGGAVYNWCPNVTFSECTFKNCSSEKDFGAIFSLYDGYAKAVGCKFIDYLNEASAVNNNTELVNCVFKKSGEEDAPIVRVDPKITGKDTTVLYTADGKYSVTVYGTDGNVAKNAEVIFKIAGKQVGKGNTNANGVATYIVKNVPGTYMITAASLGKSVTNKLTVKHVVTLKAVTVKKSAKKLVLQATLAKVNGKYLKSKQVVFKFNGKTYKTKTDSKGVAKVTIKSSVLKKLKVGKKVTYQATYLKDTVKKTAKVKK